MTYSNQYRRTCPYHRIHQCEKLVGRALGTLGAYASVGGKSGVSLYEYPNKSISLGRWGQGQFFFSVVLHSADVYGECYRLYCKVPSVMHIAIRKTMA